MKSILTATASDQAALGHWYCAEGFSVYVCSRWLRVSVHQSSPPQCSVVRSCRAQQLMSAAPLPGAQSELQSGIRAHTDPLPALLLCLLGDTECVNPLLVGHLSSFLFWFFLLILLCCEFQQQLFSPCQSNRSFYPLLLVSVEIFRPSSVLFI